jgi:hypothetical protein
LRLPMLQKLYCAYNKIITLSLQFTQHLTTIQYNNNPIEYVAPNLRNIVDRSRQNIYTDSQNVYTIIIFKNALGCRFTISYL